MWFVFRSRSFLVYVEYKKHIGEVNVKRFGYTEPMMVYKSVTYMANICMINTLIVEGSETNNISAVC